MEFLFLFYQWEINKKKLIKLLNKPSIYFSFEGHFSLLLLQLNRKVGMHGNNNKKKQHFEKENDFSIIQPNKKKNHCGVDRQRMSAATALAFMV